MGSLRGRDKGEVARAPVDSPPIAGSQRRYKMRWLYVLAWFVVHVVIVYLVNLLLLLNLEAITITEIFLFIILKLTFG